MFSQMFSQELTNMLIIGKQSAIFRPENKTFNNNDVIVVEDEELQHPRLSSYTIIPNY